MDKAYDLCVVGAGAAGLMAAITAARAGNRTAVFEKNTTAGRKLLITGGTRCNITHDLSPKDFTEACKPYHRFLRHSLYEFSPQDMRQFLAGIGVETIVQPDGCVFPVSQKACDVQQALVKEAIDGGVKFYYDKAVENIVRKDSVFTLFHKDIEVQAENVIIACGGLSYPATGSTGDGFVFARSFGHRIVKPQSSLVPLVTGEYWVGRVAGAAVGNAGLLVEGEKKKKQIRGALIFTDDGIGGPAVLNFSRKILPLLNARDSVQITVDLAADHTQEQFLSMIDRLCLQNPRKELPALFSGLLPKSLVTELSSLAGIDPGLRGASLPKKARQRLAAMVKALPLTVISTKPIGQATVTRGGVCIDEIDSGSMQSQKCENLFFAGEVMDVDGPCGGYNLQIAFSTAVTAAKLQKNGSRHSLRNKA
jgi:predicted Rossmann fold flavoprotein